MAASLEGFRTAVRRDVGKSWGRGMVNEWEIRGRGSPDLGRIWRLWVNIGERLNEGGIYATSQRLLVELSFPTQMGGNVVKRWKAFEKEKTVSLLGNDGDG